jgi:hypothetical protein
MMPVSAAVSSWRPQNPGPIDGELQVGFLVANLAKAPGLRRAATARDHPKRPALSKHDAEFQHLPFVRHSILDFFHFVSFMTAVGTGCPNGLQLSLQTGGLRARWCDRLGQMSQPRAFTIAHAFLKPAGRMCCDRSGQWMRQADFGEISMRPEFL